MRPLTRRLWPGSSGVYLIGVALLAGGLGLAVWARVYLGRNWSGTVSVKEAHELIRTGPYAIVRHPIYAGFITALVGSVLNFGHMRSFIAAVMVILAWIYKSRLEETFMRDHFGREYDQYCHDVKRLIPKIW